ncbi:MAG TPA: STAS domain-containing protein [Polyangia bacterium]|nr:STAS domain-containing protein [Polyangia bacterium]
MPFSIISLSSGATRIALEGDLHVATVARLRTELVGVARRRPAIVEVDLSRLRSVDPEGLQVLGAFFAELTRIDCRISVTEMPEEPLRPSSPLWPDAILDAARLVN